MHSQWITPNSPQWDEILSCTGHDFYHLPAYLRLCANQEAGEAFAFYARDEAHVFFLPLIVRPIGAESENRPLSYDVTCPYGYAGPLVFDRRSKNEPGNRMAVQTPYSAVDRAEEEQSSALRSFVASAALRLRDDLAARNIVSAFFRLHPLLTPYKEALCTAGSVVQNGETVFIDLSLSEEELWRQMRSGHRSEINQSLRRGYQVAMVPFLANLENFSTFYRQTMQRVGASDQYLFEQNYFLALHSALGERLHLCMVHIDGEPACAALFVETAGTVQYHLSGVGDAYIAAHPTKLMLDFVRRWAKARGAHCLHLGGGLGGKTDSLFAFKAGFSRSTAPFHTWRLIVDERRYAQLVAAWGTAAGVSPEPFDEFFPAYRNPFPQEVNRS